MANRDDVIDLMNDKTRLQAENERLRTALRVCQGTLSVLITPPKGALSGVNVSSAWASCVAAEVAARAALNGEPG